MSTVTLGDKLDKLAAQCANPQTQSTTAKSPDRYLLEKPGTENKYYNPLLDGDDLGDCRRCGGVGWLRYDAQPGQTGFGELVPCSCQSETIAERKRKRLERISGLKPGELGLRIENFIEREKDTPAMVEIVRRFLVAPTGMLTLWGGSGNGKTLALQALVNEFRVRHGWVTAYVRFIDLVDYIRAGCARNADLGKRQRYEEIKAVQLWR